MNMKKPLSMVTCGLIITGVLMAAGAASAQAYCPDDPSGIAYGTSDPKAGEYGGTEIDCRPYRESTGSLPGSAPTGWVDVDWNATPASGPLDGWAWDVTPGPFGIGLAEHKTIYESVGDGMTPPMFDFPIPGQTPEERGRTEKGPDYPARPCIHR